MSAHDMQWALGMLGTALVVIIGAFVSLLVFAFRIGRRDADLTKGEELVREVRAEVKTLAEQIREFMRHMNSDITGLKERTAALEARDEMRSHPSFHDGE